MQDSLIHPGFDRRRVDAARSELPEDWQPFTDIYFARSLEIIRARGWNPWLQAQVFIRRGERAKLAGVYDVIAVLTHYTDFFRNGGRVLSLEEGDVYNEEPCETVLWLEGWAQDFIHLETLYLSLLSASTTEANLGTWEVDLDLVERRMGEIVRATNHPVYGRRPVTYFGPRHYHWRANGVMMSACWKGGAATSSTPAGGNTVGERPSGTIPHVLENVAAFYVGDENAVREASVAFHEVIDPKVRRMSLIDYRNREIVDALAVSEAVGKDFYAHRIDTNGAVVAEGALESSQSPEADRWRQAGYYLPDDKDPMSRFWYGKGVTVTACFALRNALNDAGFENHGIVPTSGFADPAKVRAFVMAEKLLGVKLFDGIGAGEVHPGWFATMDVVGVGKDPNNVKVIHKVGRPPKPNKRLKPACGKF